MKDLSLDIQLAAQGKTPFPVFAAFRLGWDLYKKRFFSHIGYFIVSILIVLVCMLPVAFLGSMPPVLSIAGVVLMGGVFTSLAMGYSYYCYYQQRSAADFGDHFGAFQSFASLWGFTLLYYVAYLLISLPLISLLSQQMAMLTPYADPTMVYQQIAQNWYLLLLGIIVQIFIGVCVQFAPYFIVLGNLNPIQAIITSFRVVIRKWWAAFGLNLLLFIGFYLLLLLIGVPLTYIDPVLGPVTMLMMMLTAFPFMAITHYAAFSEYMGLGSDKEGIDNILAEIGSDEDPARTE